MNAPAERVFLPTLRELDRELRMPIPERVRILRELEFDLEELRGRLEAEGLSSEEACARALEKIALLTSALGVMILGLAAVSWFTLQLRWRLLLAASDVQA